MRRTLLLPLYLFLILTQIRVSFAFSTSKSPPLDTVPHLDLKQYLGKWYEIVRNPLSFEKDCVGVTAEYSQREDGDILVLNSCRKNQCQGKLKVAKGKAKIVDAKNNSKLKVSFFWPFYSPYWILEVDVNYKYAVVGTPNRKYFWILSRTPQLNSEIVQTLILKYSKMGFDLSKLIYTQPCD